MTDVGDDLSGSEPHLIVSDPDDAESGIGKLRVPAMIGFAIELGAVVDSTVDLDEEPGVEIGEVDPADPPCAPHIDLTDRFGKTTRPKQPEESRFQSALGGHVARVPFGEEVPHERASRPPVLRTVQP